MRVLHPPFLYFFFFFLMIRPPPRSPLFPYTPLFLSGIPPLLPYMFMQQPLVALKMAVIVSLVALFLVGVAKTALTQQPWLKSGLEVVFLGSRSEEHTSELQSQSNLVCRLLLEKKKNI